MVDSVSKDKWFVLAKAKRPVEMRLFCFPYAGGAASLFADWSNELPDNIQVCAIQLPGRQNRLTEVPFTQLSLVVSALSKAFRDYSELPFALFGHSMGALIEFEFTRQLRREGLRQPVHLFVASYAAPQLFRWQQPLHNLSDAGLIRALRDFRGTPEYLLKNQELMEMMLPTLRADFALCETYSYQPEPPLSCPITVFGGQYAGDVSRSELQAWAEQTTAAFNIQMFPGDHFFLTSSKKPLLDSIARILSTKTAPPERS